MESPSDTPVRGGIAAGRRHWACRTMQGGAAAQISPAWSCPGSWCRPAIRNGRRRRPLEISHLGIEKGLIMGLSPHRVRAIVALFRHPVGRSGGLRDQFAQVQYLRGFPPSAKLTYDGLSEHGKRSERDMKTICVIKAWSVPSRHLPGDWRKVPGAVRCLCRATGGGVLIPRTGGQQRCHSTEAHQVSKP